MRTTRRTRQGLTILALTGLLALLPTLGCTVQSAESGEMPDVDVEEGEDGLPDVDVEGGELPSVDIEWADVDILVGETVIEVPDVDIETEHRKIAVPLVDIDWPGEADDQSDPARRTLTVEVEAPASAVRIDEIYARHDTLIVVSRLLDDGAEAERQTLRDHVVVGAGELDVEHYVIADDPSRVEGDVTVIASIEEISDELGDARRIYARTA